MTQPTYKQVTYANRLGIKNPQNYTKEELIQMIDEKVNKTGEAHQEREEREFVQVIQDEGPYVKPEEFGHGEKASDYTMVKPKEFWKSPRSGAEYEEAMKNSRKSVKNTAYEKDPVGLAVEVFNAMLGDASIEIPIHADKMTLACDLVKQAQKAFS